MTDSYRGFSMQGRESSGVAALLAVAVVMIVSGCSDWPTSVQLHRSTVGVQPLCQLGCVQTDPDPNAPGVFLGSGVTPTACRRTNTNLITDSDGDGLGDFCEIQLATNFAPELYYAYGDDVRREPYWAARFMDDEENEVAIAYLLSYYRDTGSKGSVIGYDAHNGDSEYIILYVYYDYESEHWVLEHAAYSQHTGYTVYMRGPSDAYPPALTYPSHPGLYPRSWVAEGKHANYATQGECNNGGPLGNDTCVDNNTAARVEMASYWNVGSRSSHSIDCVASRNPSYEFYGAGRLECYWTTLNFRGWVPDSVGGKDSGTSYTSILANFAF